MRFFSTYLLLLCLLLGTTRISAQDSPTKHKILFKSGEIVFPENLDDFIAGPGKDYSFSGKLIRYIQFHDIPDIFQKRDIEKKGIRLYDYIPHNTYLASIPSDINRTQLKSLNIRSIMVPSPSEKIDPRLINQSLPFWAVKNDKIELYIRYFPEVPTKDLIQKLINEGVDITFQSQEERTLFASVPLDRMYNLANIPEISFIEPIDPPGEPEDDDARSLHRGSILDSDHPTGLKFNGNGINVLVRDDGDVGPHIDFQGRITQSGNTSTGTHGDGVAGVFASAGNLDPTNRGAAPGAHIYVIDYQSTFTDNTLTLHQVDSVMITNSSYSNGCNAGYTTTTQRVDKQIYDNPTLLHVFSAGNSNNQNCGYGAGSQWGNITGGHKQGKNVLAVANLFEDATLVNSSSRGPAHDGRIKPDIAAHGQGQISTDPNNAYQSFGGTSAAAPSSAGIITQLYQAYRELNSGSYPESGLIKAAAMNTANDLGNPGPDFKFGWGLINGYRAYKTLEENRYLDSTISQGDSILHNLSIPTGVKEARIMVYWTDKEASPSAAIALVNNIDLKVENSSGTVFLPLVLNSTPNATLLDQPAVPGVDNLNNVEQVRLTNPGSGNYTVKVSGTSVPQGPQKYYLLYEYIYDDIKVIYPSGGEGFVPGEIEKIHWDAYGNTGSYTLEYSADGGNSWNTIVSGLPAVERFYDWTVPSIATGEALIRITRGSVSAQSQDDFSIVGVTQGFSVSSVCPDSTEVSWPAVTGASGYDFFILGEKYMDSVGSTNTNSITLPDTVPIINNWISVRATGQNDMTGRKSIAEFINFVNLCQDVSLELSNPAFSVLPLCFSDSFNVKVKISNIGQNSQTGFTVSYQIGSNPIISETVNSLLNSGEDTVFTFSQTEVVSPGLSYNITAWVSVIDDQDTTNNIASQTFQYTNSTSQTSPFNHNFESQNTCSTQSNCGTTICSLSGGWVNETNGISDDIDWRVDAGGTPSSDTGPDTDHNPGTSVGKYLYTEASNGCENQVASLLSPCIDLTGTINPVLSFWYHMYGADIGELHVDIFDGDQLYPDVITPIIGSQGDIWIEATVPLVNYDSLIQIRIRGITGEGFASDIAIDDINIFDNNQPPVAEFSSNVQTACVGKPILFFDQSLQVPSSWKWSFSPNTITYTSGTDSLSSDPEVIFNQQGIYTVSLIAANTIGADTIAKTAFININDGSLLPLIENFNSAQVPPNGWSVENPDNDLTWDNAFAIGPSGFSSSVAYINNYNYNASGEEDFLLTIPLDLTSSISPFLIFDLAYARYSTSLYDELKIELSTDCGDNFSNLIYSKSNLVLATGGTQTNNWFPSNPSQWRTDSVDLSPYVGNSVVIRFVNVNGYGNNLFLDNINVQEFAQVPPQASYTFPAGPFCVDVPISLNQTSTGTNLSYSWQFTTDATPQNSNNQAPQVTFSTPGPKTITLIVANNLGSDTISQVITIQDHPVAAFAYQLNGVNSVDFTSGAVNYSTLLWDLGDGTIMNDSSFLHQYLANGMYSVSLYATNDCGTDTFALTVEITGITPPVAQFTPSEVQICEGDTVVYTDNSTGIGINSFNWEFGQGANPATASNAGPHSVVYSSGGSKNISLLVGNAEGVDSSMFTLQVDSLPVADFSYNLSGGFQTFAFNNLSQAGASYQWDFGDSTFSTDPSPIHTYLANGMYNVILIVENECGTDTVIQSIDITNVGIQENLNELGISMYPNPNSGIFQVVFERSPHSIPSFELWDNLGRKVLVLHPTEIKNSYQINATSLSKGTYILKALSGDKISLIRVLIK